GLFFVIAAWERRSARMCDTFWTVRLIFYACAILLFFVHAAGVSPIVMKSMIRYSLGVHALLLTAIGHLCAQPSSQALPKKWLKPSLGIGCIALLLIQAALAWRFLHEKWVA
ncbi:MAG TPA: hypothetical protein VHX39_36435, partial [Acetobacteraceae bacterium]|nr:hypothetical protein [Acetobacteraceae bacterium]